MIAEDKANNSHFAAELADGESLNSRRNVDLSFFVWNVNEIDIINQSFNVKFNLYASWDEDVSNMNLLDNDEAHWSKEHFNWDPQLRIMNCKETDLCECSYSVFKLQTKKGSKPIINRGEYIKPSQLSQHTAVRACFQQKIQGTFNESFELKNFPFDLQHLHIGITSKWDHHAVALTFDKTKPTRVSSQALQSQTWSLSSPRLMSYNSDWDLDSLPLLSQSIDSATGARYSRAYLALTVSRRPNWVLWNVMTIMTLVGFFTFATYALDPSELGDRQSCVLTLVLTTVAFKYVTMNMMPEISYVTMVRIFYMYITFSSDISAMCYRQPLTQCQLL